MATSTLPGAIDYLVTTLPSLTAFINAAEQVVVSDGWPSGSGNIQVVIGITPDDPDTPNERLHAELGAQAKTERYDIPCIAWSYRGGGNEAMKQARDDVFALLDAIDTHLRTNPGATLNNLLNSGIATVSSFVMRQTGAVLEAGEGRICELRFTITCNSRLNA